MQSSGVFTRGKKMCDKKSANFEIEGEHFQENIECSTVVDPKTESTKPSVEKRKTIVLTKMGNDHVFSNMNNQDYSCYIPNIKLVVDGCGSGKHSEVGAQLFTQLFSGEVKQCIDTEKEVSINTLDDIVCSVFKRMLLVWDNIHFLTENYCFTILICFETEDEFIVANCGDGFIVTEDIQGNISFDKLDDGEYPMYYIYNFIDGKHLKEYKDGAYFTFTHFSKKEYANVGVASDGLRFFDRLLDVDKRNFLDFLHNGKKGQIEKLINRNKIKFHDDISIVF